MSHPHTVATRSQLFNSHSSHGHYGLWKQATLGNCRFYCCLFLQSDLLLCIREKQRAVLTVYVPDRQKQCGASILGGNSRVHLLYSHQPNMVYKDSSSTRRPVSAGAYRWSEAIQLLLPIRI